MVASTLSLQESGRSELPLSFRQEIVPAVFQAIRASESVSLVGLRGVGQSNLFRFLCAPQVVRHYAGDVAQSYLLVYVDGNLFRDYSEASICRVMIDATTQAARHNSWAVVDKGPLQEASKHYIEYERQMTGLGVLTHVFDKLCHEKGKRIVLAVDGFDQVFIQLDTFVLRGLRALRDSHKDRLSFIVGTHAELSHLAARRGVRDWAAGIRGFWELFKRHTFGVKPYSHDDSIVLVSRKALDMDRPLSEEQLDLLIRISGGHASLLMVGLGYLRPRLDVPLRNLARGLAQDREVERSCQEIWDDLDHHERMLLLKLANEQRDGISKKEIEYLQARGLVVGSPAFIFSDLLEDFIKHHADDVVTQPTDSDTWDLSNRVWPSRIGDPQDKKRW